MPSNNKPRLTQKTSVNSINEELLLLLVCPVCEQHMMGQIQMCANGHNVCEDCRRVIDHCPECMLPYSGARNRLVESVALKLMYPCENAAAGCKKRLHKDNLEDHAFVCPYRIYECLLENSQECIWSGTKEKMLEHFKEAHSEFVLNGNSYWFNWKGDRYFTSALISMYGELFWYFTREDKAKQLVYVGVQFIGPQEKAEMYTYQLEIASPDPARKIFMSEVTHCDTESCERIMETRKCMEITTKKLKHFRDRRNEIQFKLCLFQNISVTNVKLNL